MRERRRIAYFNEVGSEKPFKVEKPQPWQQVEQTTWTEEKFIIRDESGKIKCLSLHVAPEAIEEETRKDEVEKDEEIARLLGHIISIELVRINSHRPQTKKEVSDRNKLEKIIMVRGRNSSSNNRRRVSD